MPGRVRCEQCGEVWPGLARFCGRCGAVLRTVEEYGALDPVAEDRNRSRRRLVRTVVLIVLVLVIAAFLVTRGGPEAPPEDPLPDPQLLPAVDVVI